MPSSSSTVTVSRLMSAELTGPVAGGVRTRLARLGRAAVSSGRSDAGRRATGVSRSCCTPSETPSSSRATRRSGRTSIRRSPASSRTGETSRSRGARPCALFDQSHHMTDLYVKGPDVIRLLSDARRQHVRELRRQQGEAVRGLQSRRLRDRRRDPVLPRREQRQPRRPPLRPQLGAVPRRDRRLRRAGRPRRADGGEPDAAGGSSTATRFRGRPRSRCWTAANGGSLPGDQVLQHGRAHDRRAQGPRAAPRHVRRAGDGALRALGGRARRSRPRSSRPAGTSASGRSARGSTRRTRSSRAGSRARCPRSSPATS